MHRVKFALKTAYHTAGSFCYWSSPE